MMLIIFVALIANSALLSDARGVAPQIVVDFDWNKVGISVLTCLF